jgi:hypothetical protein
VELKGKGRLLYCFILAFIIIGELIYIEHKTIYTSKIVNIFILFILFSECLLFCVLLKYSMATTIIYIRCVDILFLCCFSSPQFND